MNRDHKITNAHELMKISRPSLYSNSGAFLGEQEKSTSSQRPQIKHILIVDDDSSIAGMLGEHLAEWGYEVFHASNGREGLQMVKSHFIDGILLDLEMPVMDGWTMLDELRWRNDDVPVMVMSGEVSVESMRSLLCEGAQGFLTKPFHLQDLQKKCLQIFGRSVKENAHIPVWCSTSERAQLKNAVSYPSTQTGGK